MFTKKLTGLILAGLLMIGSAFAGDQYMIDKAHTRVGFAVKHMVLSTVRGDFKEYSGKIYFDENDVTKSTVEGTIQVASINTGDEKRDKHLLSPDFFDVKKYPEITFKSKKIQKQSKNYVMIADLTMHGVTKEVQVPFKVLGIINDPMGNKRIGIEAKFKINRKDYGVSWSKTMDNGGLVVSDDVTIELAFEGVKMK
ncbi:MAG TPA: polyisoprenoid-binding protein [Bacteroidetes bacterium]|nr:polyisoprenoid-binding protein [Bacteroidota bacterium]